MRDSLKALLVVVGAATSTGIAVWTFLPSSPPVLFKDLQDAGLSVDCNPVVAVTSEDVGPILRARLIDGGCALRPRQTHARLYRQAYRCPDGGSADLIVPGLRRFALNGTTDYPEGDTDDGPLFSLPKVVTCASVASFCGNGPLNVACAQLELPPCVRANFDAGLMCLRLRADGGTYSLGDANVFDRATAADAGACESVECGIYFGEQPENL